MPLALLLSREEHVYEKYFDITFDTLQLPKADLVVFPGGSDWNPQYYGKLPHPNTSSYRQTDEYQMYIAREAIKRKKKLAGHCRGAQLLCILNGDTLIQHVTGHVGGTHAMEIVDGRVIRVNSIHHQMMAPREDFKLLAWSHSLLSDRYETTDKNGEIDIQAPLIINDLIREPEAVYFNKIKGLAVQYHPEWMGESTDGYQYYQELIQEYLL